MDTDGSVDLGGVGWSGSMGRGGGDNCNAFNNKVTFQKIRVSVNRNVYVCIVLRRRILGKLMSSLLNIVLDRVRAFE